MKNQFIFEESRCVACGACVTACLDQNDLYPLHGDFPFRRCETIEERTATGEHMIYRSVGCMHCADAPCVRACPNKCLFKDEETGFTLYDNRACVGCRRCLKACPYDAPVFPERSGKMEKCDGCVERVRNGLEPACARVCPFQALMFSEPAEQE